MATQVNTARKIVSLPQQEDLEGTSEKKEGLLLQYCCRLVAAAANHTGYGKGEDQRTVRFAQNDNTRPFLRS